jgi:hypothetical protein
MLAASQLGASLLGALLLAPDWWPASPQPQVPRQPAQQPLLERRVAHASAQVALPERQTARSWQQEAWPPAPDSA